MGNIKVDEKIINIERKIVWIDDPMPLVGHIAFGIVDRGTNLLQVRPYTACNLSCIFCSVDAGPNSRSRVAEFIVNIDHLIDWVKYVMSFKRSRRIHILIDGVGEPLLHPKIIDLIQRLREIERIGEIAVETHGGVLNERIIKDLRDAGLTRINVSVHSLDPLKASWLTGTDKYDIKKVLEMIIYANNIDIDIMLTPVWIPGVNDHDIEEIVLWAKDNIKNNSSPILGVQKYIVHKRGRRISGVDEPSWDHFYNFLNVLEKKTGVKLKISPQDFDVKPDNPLPKPMKIGDKVVVKIYSIGWLRGEYIGYAKNRVVTILTDQELEKDVEARVKIIYDKDNIYLSRIY
jgi:uncharacterized Fe-S cluster-containing radical SAM superfamily enzyme